MSKGLKNGSFSVFKTYRFELRNVSSCKFKKLTQTFTQSDMLYYKALMKVEDIANEISLLKNKKERQIRVSKLQTELQNVVKPVPYGNALKASIVESIKQQVSSFVELKVSGQNPSYPSKINDEIDYNYWFDVLMQSTDIDTENEARDMIYRKLKEPYRPLTFEKYRVSDGFMILSDSKGRLFALLNLWGMNDKRASQLSIDMIDTRTGLEFKTKTKVAMLLPLSFSQQQLDALHRGEAKTAKLVMRGDRLFLMVSVKFEVPRREPKLIMGIDQGITEVATYAIREPETGKVIKTGSFSGAILKSHQQRLELKQKNNQKLGRRFIQGWSNYSANLMHHVANEIVKAADKYQCQVVIEDLKNLKNGFRQKRKNGACKNNFRRSLSRQQYGRLEMMLEYKLNNIGLPKPKKVHSAYTSQICPKCGHLEKANRATRDLFECKHCRYLLHADVVGALNIAGSYICYERVKSKLKKGKPRPSELKYSNWLMENLQL